MSISYLVYSQSIEKKVQLLGELQLKKERLLSEKVLLIEKQKELAMELASSHDPAWIELSLMRRLGVVPEGQVKVHFSSDP
ncbi:MAG: hypothetical protein SNF33_01710 [Candidatus Algichlamydia australiensis]|nr:hypothetical protein [Chlamydiales bacterium]